MRIIKILLLVVIPISVSICLAQKINVSGKVVDELGIGIEGAKVKLEIRGLLATTEADGSFLLFNNTPISSNQIFQPKIKASVSHGLFRVNVLEKSYVEIIIYSIQGRVLSVIHKLLNEGINSFKLPYLGAGLYLYKIKVGNNEIILKSYSFDRITGLTSPSLYGTSARDLTKQGVHYEPIYDVIRVTDDNYLNYRTIIYNSDTSGIEMQMKKCAGIIKDIEQNEYQVVKIGNQMWTIENLRTTKFNDGSDIPHVTDSAEWESLNTPGYCYYNNSTNSDTIIKNGVLYNWYVVNTKKLAPTGWHVPSESDWDTLQNYLIANGYNWDGTSDSNKISKSLAERTDWKYSSKPQAPGNTKFKNNKTGFSALPSGFRSNFGKFFRFEQQCFWWSSTEDNESQAYYCYLDYNFQYLYRSSFYDKKSGFSVRLIKDRF